MLFASGSLLVIFNNEYPRHGKGRGEKTHERRWNIANVSSGRGVVTAPSETPTDVVA